MTPRPTRLAALCAALAALIACDLPESDDDDTFVPLPEDGCPDGMEATSTGSLAITQIFVGGGPVYLDYLPGTLRTGEAGTCMAQNGTAAQWALLVDEDRVGTITVQVPATGTWALPDADVRLTWTLDAGDAVGIGGTWEAFDAGELQATVAEGPAGLGVLATGVRAVSGDGTTLYADLVATAGPGGVAP